MYEIGKEIARKGGCPFKHSYIFKEITGSLDTEHLKDLYLGFADEVFPKINDPKKRMCFINLYIDGILETERENGYLYVDAVVSWAKEKNLIPGNIREKSKT